ncbi:MAG: TonB-dependent receptor domain-containing protein, partial [Cyclobacteriaceae bacterium]
MHLSYGQQRQWQGRPGGGSTLKGKITGVLLDVQSGDPLPYVSVVVKDLKTQMDVGGTITEENGSFKLSNVNLGKYQLITSFVGYETIRQEVTLTPKNPDVNLGNLTMTSTTTELDEVVVEGERELVENKIDKIVYNAERDVANIGGDASDVLRRTPLLSVDLEGNVSLRGSQNLQILINGKPSTMFGSSPADAFKAIPADNIKSVEVITTPSAKYDGEGTAGIINIITKKKNVEGFAGNVNLSLGTRQNSAVVGINAGKGRFGFNANGNTFFSWPNDGDYSFYREDFIGGQSRILSEDGVTETSRIGFFGTLGAFYDFNAYHSLTTSFRIRGFSFDRDGVTDASFIDPLNAINQSYQRSSISDNLRSGYEWSLDYTIKFPGQKERELAFAYKLDGNVQDQKYIITQEDLVGEDPSLFRDERNDNDGNNRENILQADYVHPVSDNFKIEAGGKTTLRKVNSDYTYFNREGSEYIVDPGRTDFFDYQQDVMAGYFSSNVKMGEKYGLIAGIRYERTTIEGDIDNEGSSFANDYNNWLPSMIVSRKLGKTTTLKLSYNRRIQRPSLRFINPYTQLDNNRNISVGNPELDPELNDQVELGFNTFIKKVSLNLAVFHRHTSDIIESILTVDEDGVSVTTFENVGENNSIG